MTEQELHAHLHTHYPTENQGCEHKLFARLKNVISGNAGDDVVSYVSALANMEGGQLIIGVEDDTLNIRGIADCHNFTPENLPHRLMGNCINLSSEGLRVEEFVTQDTGKRVWVLHVPKHQPRKPVFAHKKGWQRCGDSLIELSREREAAILAEPVSANEDWSIQVVGGATLDDLSPEAIAAARNHFKKKNAALAAEIDGWSDEVFLNKAKLTIQGKITCAALVLLGKPESDHFLSPAVVTLSWIVKDRDGLEEDYEHFSAPLILAVDKLFARIRNLKYRYMADSTLFPEEVDKYDTWVIREALHNCIAHQDYQLGARVVVVEFPDRLVFSNKGAFIPGDVERVIRMDSPEPYYRNRFLAQAMVSLNMIDTVGSGIRKMYLTQRRRFFPMPDYCIEPDGVMVTIYGRIVDERFSKLLAADPGLLLHDVILLDKVQKGYPLSDDEIKALRDRKLIEGRKPNLFVSAKVAKATGQKAAYTRQKALDKQYYLDMILKLIEKHGEVGRADIDELLWKKLPEFMDEKQRKIKINNLLGELSRQQGKIRNIGTRGQPRWVLAGC